MHWFIFFSDPWLWFDPSTPMLEIYEFYNRNLLRFAKMAQKGELQKLLRSGKFSTEPPNNLELLLRYADKKLGGVVNSTKDK